MSNRRIAPPLDLLPHVLDYCAGIGGWDVALRRRGLEGAGIERDEHAHAARVANGLLTVWRDLTTLPEALVRTPWAGAVGSFPCQPFSQGNHAAKANPLDDPRARLMHVGLEHLLAALPPFVCLENVRKASWLMEELAAALRAVGYTAEVRILNAADYGLPQARVRAILVARRDGLETEERYVEVPGGLMDVLDYVDEGGQVWHRILVEPLEELGRMTDAAIVQLTQEA